MYDIGQLCSVIAVPIEEAMEVIHGMLHDLAIDSGRISTLLETCLIKIDIFLQYFEQK